ncbi:AAA family ATPase [Desulfobacter curvatus]|uniref:AAA family ATPase n=1 Tax=Desulfobacter curvatus TaxID=2290 RepID=UPI00037875DD|nr:AAA family ATPase [Desulfobacter curvatus]
MKKYLNLIIALSGPHGAGCSSLADDLEKIVNNWPGCCAIRIHVADLIERYYHLIVNEALSVNKDSQPQRRQGLQEAGTKMRRKDPESIGKIISTEIYHSGLKFEEKQDQNINTIVFIVDSLKNKYELELLRKTYGQEFYFVFVHADKEGRWRRLIDYKSWDKNDRVEFEQRDQIDQEEKIFDPTVKAFGQQVQKLSSKADYYIVNNTNREDLKEDGQRLIDLLFGSDSNQPTFHERNMHIAYSASNSSFCLSRQVGAAIVDQNGNILGVGHNDVPKAMGGLYTNGDVDDRRCFAVGDRRCINDTNKEERYDLLLKNRLCSL